MPDPINPIKSEDLTPLDQEPTPLVREPTGQAGQAPEATPPEPAPIQAPINTSPAPPQQVRGRTLSKFGEGRVRQ